MSKQPRSLKSRALQLLAQREQSHVELRRKLLAHAMAEAAAAENAGVATEGADSAGQRADAEAQVEAVLAWLEANRFLSAERFAESRVNARSERYGNLRIRHELAQHEISLTPEAGQALVESEFARARAVCARKFRSPPDSATERARRARFLGARGFSADVIRRVLREASRPACGNT